MITVAKLAILTKKSDFIIYKIINSNIEDIIFTRNIDFRTYFIITIVNGQNGQKSCTIKHGKPRVINFH